MRAIATALLFLAAGCTRLATAASTHFDGEEVYRQNCRRCHIAIHTFQPRMMATVVHHMQVRATLTREEQAAVLQYLLQTSPAKRSGPRRIPAAIGRTNP